MIHAVIDTSVWIAGIFWHGPAHHVLSAWRQGEFDVVLSSPLWDELTRKLKVKTAEFHSDPAVTDEWLEFTPTREDASAWLKIEQNGSGMSIEVNEDAVEPYIASLQTAVGDERSINSEAAKATLIAGLRGEEMEPLKVEYLSRYYVVTPQDTLISISFKVGIPYWQWLEDNPDVKARGLREGATPCSPMAVLYPITLLFWQN